MHILLKAEELHHGVLGQFSWVWVSHCGVTGAGEHTATVLPECIDTRVPHLQEETSLDGVEDAVGVINLVEEKVGIRKTSYQYPQISTCLPTDRFTYLIIFFPTYIPTNLLTYLVIYLHTHLITHLSTY